MPSDGRYIDRSERASPSKSNLVPRDGDCVTETVIGPEVMVPARLLSDALGSTVKVSAPLPVCWPDVTCIQDEVVVPRQLHPPPAVTATFPLPPAEPKLTEVCDTEPGQPDGCCT